MMNFLPAGRRQKKMWEITKKFARQVYGIFRFEKLFDNNYK